MGSILDVLHLASPPSHRVRHRPALLDWSALPQDLIDEVVVALWKVDPEAPRIAAVSSPFQHASRSAEHTLSHMDVPVPRRYLRTGVNESHEPINDVVKHELAKVRAKAGDALEGAIRALHGPAAWPPQLSGLGGHLPDDAARRDHHPSIQQRGRLQANPTFSCLKKPFLSLS